MIRDEGLDFFLPGDGGVFFQGEGTDHGVVEGSQHWGQVAFLKQNKNITVAVYARFPNTVTVALVHI